MTEDLPDTCYLISVDLCDVTKELENILKQTLMNAEVTYINPDEAVISKVFGSISRTLQEVHKLSVEKLTC